MSFFHRLYATDSRGFVISRFVRTVRRNVKLTLILCFGSNRNAFHLYRATSAVCSSTPCYEHAWLSKGCGYCKELSVPHTLAILCVIGPNGTLQIDLTLYSTFSLHNELNQFYWSQPMEQNFQRRTKSPLNCNGKNVHFQWYVHKANNW